MLDNLRLLELLDRKIRHALALHILLDFGLRLGLRQLLSLSFNIIEWLSSNSLHGFVGCITGFTLVFHDNIFELLIAAHVPLRLKLHRVFILRLFGLHVEELKSVLLIEVHLFELFVQAHISERRFFSLVKVTRFLLLLLF